ncbi:hypothetical protein L5D93_23985 [Paenibacillus thiaminolyticus]|nr:hypothetical protein [Paenibacillus thiaminolyticus]
MEHSGDATATHSYMMFSPEENIGFYYSYDSAAASIDPAGDFFDTFLPGFWPAAFSGGGHGRGRRFAS